MDSAFQEWARQYGIQPTSPIGRGLGELESGAGAIGAAARLPATAAQTGYDVGRRIPEMLGRGLVGLTQAPEPGRDNVEVSESALVPGIETSSTGIPIEGPHSTTAPPSNPHGTSAPDESGANAGVFTDPEWAAMGQQHAAATYKPSVRAIRMPNGHMLFTNRDEYGGEEFTPQQGGQIVREQQRQMPTPARPPFEGDITHAAMTGLVRASMRASAGEPSPGQLRGRMVEGKAPDTTGGSVSMIEGTDEQQLADKIQTAMGHQQLAELGQNLELARMPAGERLLAQNPQVQTAVGLSRMFLPQIQQLQAAADNRIKLVSTPGSPSYIADPKLQASEIMKARAEMQAELGPIQYLISNIMGVRPVASY